MSLLSGHNIDYRIEAIRILEDIDIQVQAGELVGLIGPNGAGKSSLLRLLTGVETCTGGEVRFEDKPPVGDASHATSAAHGLPGAGCHGLLAIQCREGGRTGAYSLPEMVATAFRRRPAKGRGGDDKNRDPGFS